MEAGRAGATGVVGARPVGRRRRQDLLDLLDQLTPKIEELTAARAGGGAATVARRLMTHPGVGPITALAFELVIGTPERFRCGKQIGSYLGLIPARIPAPTATTGTHQQAGQRAAALPAGGSRASHGAQRSSMAAAVRSPGHAAATQYRHRRHGPQIGGELYWMWRQGGDDDRHPEPVRTRGSPEIPMVCSKSPPYDWAPRSPSPGSLKK